MATKLGLGIKHDVPMSAITQGLVPSRDWKLENRDQEWLICDTVNASIGQGYVLSSPLQLAVMTARLASGRNVNPILTKSINGQNINNLKNIEDLDKDKLIDDVLGAVMKKSLLAYKNDEWERYHQAVTDWEVKEYLRLY